MVGFPLTCFLQQPSKLNVLGVSADGGDKIGSWRFDSKLPAGLGATDFAALQINGAAPTGGYSYASGATEINLTYAAFTSNGQPYTVLSSDTFNPSSGVLSDD